ncbi:MAG: transcriptional regulator [Chloroflexi bacterium]|nr:MAG: transcriptional regulator [Chloroflexota bacterium]
MYSMCKMNGTKQEIGCIKAAAEILGDKWTPQLLRFFLNEESVRFCQIQDLVGGINPRTLSARLAQLEENGIITKTPTVVASRCEYQLTEKGRDLLPVLRSMQRWSNKYAPIAV